MIPPSRMACALLLTLGAAGAVEAQQTEPLTDVGVAVAPADADQPSPASEPVGVTQPIASSDPATSTETVTSQPMEQPPTAADAEPDVDVVPITGRFYGFIEELFNATTAEPNGDQRANGGIARAKSVLDLALPAFHIMAQGTLYERFHFYFNLAAPDSDEPLVDVPVGLRNAWLDTSLFGDYLSLRLGKLYRRFGLYNEILDTSPSFIGVETPASITGNRPLLTRTTNLMVHGRASFGSSTISYAFTAGKDERSRDDLIFSPGFDLKYDWDSTILVGTSFYTTAGTVLPDIAPGEGSPAGGVAPWMDHDRFQVYGGYARLTMGAFLLQGEAWFSPHTATRDPDKVLLTARNATSFSVANRARLGVDASSTNADQVHTVAHYTYSTIDMRAAYTFEFGSGDEPVELTPYLSWEYNRDPESIVDRRYGGDGEAGQSPRGIMMHNRLGCIIKPVPVVAIKTEVTVGLFDYGNHYATDLEFWAALSYQWELINR
jgi:hypothetical protein